MSKPMRKPVQKSLVETIMGSEKVEMDVFRIAKETKVGQGPKAVKKWQRTGKEL